MTDDLRRLLHEAADGITPGDRRDAIRAGAANAPRRPAAGVVMAMAAAATVAVVGGVGWISGLFDPAAQPPPVDQPTATAPQSPGETPEPPTETTVPDPTEEFTVAVYYLGDTPMGSRLYREFRTVTDESALLAAVRTAVQGDAEDPDYWTPWPTEVTDARVAGDVIEIDLAAVPTAADAADEAEAALALEQVIRTAQAAIGDRLPVQFRADGNPVAEVFGQPTSEPLAEGEWFRVLALVSISDPAEATTVSSETLVVRGVASSFEATVPWRLLGPDGTAVRSGFTTAEGWQDRLYPFEFEIDLSGLPGGAYVVEVSTDDPSGGEEGPGPTVDTRTIHRP